MKNAAWVYANVDGYDTIFEVSDAGDSDSRVFISRATNGALCFGVAEGGIELINVETSAGLIPLDTWTHVAVTVDATGDGDVAFAAGAEFDQGRGAGPNWEADGLVQPMTIMFRVAGVKHAETMETNGGRRAYRFPDGRTWNQLTKDANARGELPPTVGMCEPTCLAAMRSESSMRLRSTAWTARKSKI